MDLFHAQVFLTYLKLGVDMSPQTLVTMLTLTIWFSSSTMSTRVWYLIFSILDDVIGVACMTSMSWMLELFSTMWHV